LPSNNPTESNPAYTFVQFSSRQAAKIAKGILFRQPVYHSGDTLFHEHMLKARKAIQPSVRELKRCAAFTDLPLARRFHAQVFSVIFAALRV